MRTVRASILERSEETRTKVLAISHGAPLEQCTNAPQALADCLHRAADESPSRGIGYLHEDDSETFQAYPALLKDAEQLCGGLKDLRLQAGERIIFQFDQNEDFICAFWACILGGLVPVPIGVPLLRHPSSSGVRKLRNAWEYLGHPVILSTDKMIESVRDCFNVQESTDLRVEAIDGRLKAECDPSEHHSEPADLALLMLTSGSTGAPKVVMLSHENLMSRSRGSIQTNGFSMRDVSLNWMPLDHVAGLIYFHVRDVYLGSQQVHVPTELVLSNPLKWLDCMERYRATITFAPNFAYGLVNDCAEALSGRRWDLSSMRCILNGGEAIVAKTARQFLKLLRPHELLPTAMHPAWGMSETSSGITYSDNFSLETTTDDDSFVESGRPIPGVSLRIVDEGRNLVEEEVVGSLQVKGLPVTAGYCGRAKDDRETFTEDGWLKTGDLGFLRQGRLTITGREKDIIIINGVNYYSHEIEAVVEEIDGVESSFTAACAVREKQSNTDRLAVFFHPSSDELGPLEELLQEIYRTIVRHFGIRPVYLIPVERETIPKTSIGKIQRSHLVESFYTGTFNRILNRVDRALASRYLEYAAPRTPVEESLAGIWAEVLELGRVGIHDNFLDLGGHSLAASRVIARVLQHFQLELPLQTLFQSSTIAEMAAAITDGQARKLDQEDLDCLLAELESMTDEEVIRVFKYTSRQME